MPTRINLEGKKFGKLVAISPTNKRVSGQIVWLCRCICGNSSEVPAGNLVHGKTKSCGCGKNEIRFSSSRVSKKCFDCGIVKTIDNFTLDNTRADKHSYRCKDCTKLWSVKFLPRRLKYLREYDKNRRKSDVKFKITSNLRTRVHNALKGNSKSSKTEELIGCSVEYLKDYLQLKFDVNMTWENYGSYWHIDHIIPCSAFDLSIEENQRNCFSYTNLQPLEKYENLRKGDRICPQ